MNVDQSDIRTLAENHFGATGGVLSALRSIQTAFRCVPFDADAIIADVFNLSRAEVRGIVSFYSDFSREPQAKTVIRVCAAEACQAMGARSLLRQLELKEGLGPVSPDDIQVEKVYCLGLCSVAPATMVNGELIGRADKARIRDCVSKCAKGDAS